MKLSLLLPAGLALAMIGAALAGQSYAYKCPKCGLIQNYTRPGHYKCPTDGWVMVQAQ